MMVLLPMPQVCVLTDLYASASSYLSERVCVPKDPGEGTHTEKERIKNPAQSMIGIF